jgi:RNA polymerase sigma factor (sigma-70 family)
MYNSELRANMKNNCQPISNAKNLELYRRLISGDISAKAGLICDNMPLVVSIVDREFTKRCPKRRRTQDDLIGEGFLALTKAINGLARSKKPVEHVGGYLSMAIRHALYKAVCADDKDTSLSLDENREGYKDRGFFGEYYGESTNEDNREHRCYDALAVDLGSEVETRDLLNAACVTDQDRTILDLRERGLTFREIAAEVGLSFKTVHRRLVGIRDRYDQKVKNTR